VKIQFPYWVIIGFPLTGYATEQGKVWAHVADMSHEMAAPTMTGAMNDVLEQREGSIGVLDRRHSASIKDGTPIARFPPTPRMARSEAYEFRASIPGACDSLEGP